MHICALGSPSSTFGRHCNLAVSISEKVVARPWRMELSTAVQAHSLYVVAKLSFFDL